MAHLHTRRSEKMYLSLPDRSLHAIAVITFYFTINSILNMTAEICEAEPRVREISCLIGN
jgi:hypothetical protein